MVTYGPWQEPAEYTETWTLGLLPDGKFGLLSTAIDPVPQIAGVPMTYSGWRGLGGLQPNRLFYSGMHSMDMSFDGDLNDGRYDTPQISADAWDDLYVYDEDRMVGAYGGSINPGENAVEPPTILYSSTQQFEVWSAGYKVHEENWYASSVEILPEWVIRSHNNATYEAILGIPAHDPEVWYEVDPTRNGVALLGEPVSLSVDAVIAGDDRWKLHVVDTDTPAVDWRVSFSESSETLLFDALRNHGLVQSDGEFDFSVAPIEAWKQAAGWNNSYSVGDEKMPHIGIAWTGPWPEWSWPHEPDDIPALPTITVTYTWQAPAWRFVYPEPETIPYRRIYPQRDDALSGGARRNYPPSRTIQTGNRTSGGIL